MSSPVEVVTSATLPASSITTHLSTPHRHVILHDGTCSDKGFERETIISRLNELASNDPDGTQITIYYSGVGTGFSAVGRLWGGLTGRGLHDIILKSFDYLTSNYRPGDMVILIGYSRGGFASMVLAALLARTGVPTIRSGYVLQQLWKKFQSGELEDPASCATLMFNESYKCIRVPINLLCCIDAVAAEGCPRSGMLKILKCLPSSFQKLAFCLNEMPNNIRVYRHIRALHEFRKPYMNIELPTRIDSSIDSWIIWMPGSHSDLANGDATLYTVISQLVDAGCWFHNDAMDRRFPGFTTCPNLPNTTSLGVWPVAKLHDTWRSPYPLAGYSARVPGTISWTDSGLEVRECIHISARYRACGMTANTQAIPGHRCVEIGNGFEWRKWGAWSKTGTWRSYEGKGRPSVIRVHQRPLPEAIVGQVEAKLTFCRTK